MEDDQNGIWSGTLHDNVVVMRTNLKKVYKQVCVKNTSCLVDPKSFPHSEEEVVLVNTKCPQQVTTSYQTVHS